MKTVMIQKDLKYRLNIDMLTKEFLIVNNVYEADVILMLNHCSMIDVLPDDTIKKIIIIMMEAPVLSYTKTSYKYANKLHSFYCFSPQELYHKPVTTNPSLFPYNPFYLSDIRRTNTTLTKRHIFYAGKRNTFNEAREEQYGNINLYDIRIKLAEYLLKNYPETTVIGAGWNVETASNVIDWHIQKLKDIELCKADFVLCIENSMFKDYLTEKIHDGFSSDRVVLYLGEPNVEKYIPENCFINLNKYFNKETREFDYQKIIDIITNMTQEEYDTILNNARRWRESIKGKFEEERDKFTLKLIEDIKNV